MDSTSVLALLDHQFMAKYRVSDVDFYYFYAIYSYW